MSYFTHCMLFLFYFSLSVNQAVFGFLVSSAISLIQVKVIEMKKICPYYILEIEYMEVNTSIKNDRMLIK